MKKGRFSEARIVTILQQQASGQTVAQVVRKHPRLQSAGARRPRRYR